MAAKNTAGSQEFLYVPTGNIMVPDQVRSNVNTEADSFKSLMQSINDRGILEPIIVTAQEDGTYTLICGERRYQAARKIGLETVPVRVIETGMESGEVIVYQLTENLQREDLNPIDQAKGIYAYFQAKNPDPRQERPGAGKEYNVDGVMSDLVVYERRPEDLPTEIRVTVTQISEIIGKSIKTLFNVISLLKLVPEIQDAVSVGTLPVSQGYLFAANLGSPDFFTIFNKIIETPVTNAKLEKMLTAYKKAKPGLSGPKPVSMKKKVAGIEAAKSYFEEKAGMYAKSDLLTFLDRLRSLTLLIEQQIENAPETVPAKKLPVGPMV
jgi:hypothetical protein